MRSARKVWNLTMSAPAVTAASTRARAVSSEPSWLTPASAMMVVCPAGVMSHRLRQIEEALLRQRAEIIDAGEDFDDAARAVAVAIGIGDRLLRPLQRRGDGGSDGAALAPAGDHRCRSEPPLLSLADIDRRRTQRRRLVEAARRIADDGVRFAQQVQIEPRAERHEEARIGV